jgi:hypothetical protein
MKIQEEKVLTLLSGSQNSISNIEFPVHTALIFLEQEKVKNQDKEKWAYHKLFTQYIILKDMICLVAKIINKI